MINGKVFGVDMHGRHGEVGNKSRVVGRATLPNDGFFDLIELMKTNNPIIIISFIKAFIGLTPIIAGDNTNPLETLNASLPLKVKFKALRCGSSIDGIWFEYRPSKL